MAAIVGLGMLHRRPLVARWFSRWRWMRASSDGPAPFPRSADAAAMFLTSPPAQKAPPAPVSTTQPTASSASTWARTAPRADTMPWEKAFRRSGRFMVITATPSSTSARRSSVPVSSALMSAFLACEADPADHPWPAAGQSGDDHLGDSLAMTAAGRHEPQPLACLRQFYLRAWLALGSGDPEHRRPAPGRGGRVVDLDRQPGHAALGMFGHPSRPRRARPPPRLLRGGPVQGHDGAGDVPGMQVGRGDVGQFGGPDHAYPQVGDPAAGRGQVRDLEYRHVPAVTAPPLEVPAGGRVRLRGRHHLHERVAGREDRVDQAEPSHPRIVKGRRPAEGPAQLASYLAAVARHQGYLAQPRSAQHTPTIGRP